MALMTSSAEAAIVRSGQAQESKIEPAATPASPVKMEAAAAPAVWIKNLTKRYGELMAVDDLSLAVPTGKMFGFLGPNGAGKSTTIGCLTGLIDPTSGKIELLGEEFTSDSIALKRRIGV